MLTLLAQLSPILFSSFSKIHNLPIDAKLDISKQIHWLNIGIFPHKKKYNFSLLIQQEKSRFCPNYIIHYILTFNAISGHNNKYEDTAVQSELPGPFHLI